MKKKIVYISGAETFDVNDVRAAFEEVRNTLKLAPDTILFGVPVDEAESVSTESVTPHDVIRENVLPAECFESDEEIVDDVCAQGTPDCVAESESDAEPKESNAPVVPILNVLSTDSTDDEQNTPVAKPETKKKTTKKEPTNSDTNILDEINDEMPSESEKTLEELLETMAPLREDVVISQTEEIVVNDDKHVQPSEEIDATLESLASEFAENQDKVAPSKKGSERGKIGKLKNILPFKKMKRDDSGIMGDLFGWAGIAANDEDFTMPGFFKSKM